MPGFFAWDFANLPLTTLCFFWWEDEPLGAETGAMSVESECSKGLLVVVKVAKSRAEVARSALAVNGFPCTALLSRGRSGGSRWKR